MYRRESVPQLPPSGKFSKYAECINFLTNCFAPTCIMKLIHLHKYELLPHCIYLRSSMPLNTLSRKRAQEITSTYYSQ